LSFLRPLWRGRTGRGNTGGIAEWGASIGLAVGRAGLAGTDPHPVRAGPGGIRCFDGPFGRAGGGGAGGDGFFRFGAAGAAWGARGSRGPDGGFADGGRSGVRRAVEIVAGGTVPIAGRGGDDAAGVWLDGLARRPDLS